METSALGLYLSLDPLSLFFLGVIALVSLPATIYSAGYLKIHYSSGQARLCHVLAGLFIASMAAVVVSPDILTFLVSWEIMSLVSFFLVAFDHEQSDSVRAGLLYIVMTHFGTALLIAAFLIMHSYAGSWDFSAVRSACSAMPPAMRTVLFLLLLAGFGTKAGIVPLHIWLPAAHPRAPSHISAIMSGVMIKTAVYGFIRFIIQILGISHQWWAIVLLFLAAVSCLVGVIYALMDHDLKKLLAFHSVENIGIILLGVGASMLFIRLGLPDLAVAGLAAGLYHLVNHAVFKALLFLAAGSVYVSCGTRDMEKLGGLIKNMPLTAACFLIGSLAISAIPPLNGFISEWLTLQVFFQGAWSVLPGWLTLLLGAFAASLAFTGGLAAACFVKAFGITFLARPRSQAYLKASDPGFSMKAGMIFLSLATVVLGLAAVPVFGLLRQVAAHTLGREAAAVPDMFRLTLTGQPAALSNVTLAFLLIAAAAAGAVMFRTSRQRVFKAWDCGYYRIDSRNEYTATAQSKPFRLAFNFFLLPHRSVRRIRKSYYHFMRFSYETHTTPVFGKFLYRPLAASIFRFSGVIKRLQAGSIHVYIGYIFVTLVVLLALSIR